MRITKLFAIFFTFVVCFEASAQRFLKPVFNKVSTTTIVYGSNFTVLPLVYTLGHTVRQQLAAQVYTPTGDTDTKRPLVILLHAGNFLPFSTTKSTNGVCGGTIGDSSVVEIATRLTKMGYVVAVADYRIGWNIWSTVELTRRFTFINAVYRGVQDVRTCIRYFRKSVDVDGNPFGIDPNKIVVFGEGAGGYISMAAAYLNTYNEILTTSDPNKFILSLGAIFKLPMIREAYNGDIFGTPATPCIVDAMYNAYTNMPIGDTLCVSNHPGYSSAFNLAVNLGGALGDSTWIDAGEIPLISYYVPADIFMPCQVGVVNASSLYVGSCDVQAQINRMGINKVFSDAAIAAKNLQLYDKFGAIGKARSGKLTGSYPFVGTINNTSSPWEWAAIAPATISQNCNSNKFIATPYIDTIINYFAVRAAVALDFQVVRTQDINRNIEMQIAPNPAIDQTVVTVPADYQMESMDVVDASGRLVRHIAGINSNIYALDRADTPRGMYFLKTYFKEGIVIRKVVFE